MTENTQPNDDEILARAREIQAERGVSLTDAMLSAEEELTPKAPLQTTFTVVLELKPRVARWLLKEFTPTETHTPEERLAVYLSTVLNRSRVSALRATEEPPEISKGRAVSMRRAQFQEKAPQ